MSVSSEEDARKLLQEIEALKQRVLGKYPGAAEATKANNEAPTTDDCALPGQVEDHSNRSPESRSINTIREAVKSEMSKWEPGLRRKVWREIVVEELGRLKNTGSNLASQSAAVSSNESGDEVEAERATSSHENQTESQKSPSRQNHNSPGHPHGHGHAQRVYNAECVLKAAGGYVQYPVPRSRNATPRDDPGAGSNGNESGNVQEGEATKNEKEKTDSDDPGDDPDGTWVTVSENAYGAFIHVGLQSGSSCMTWTMTDIQEAAIRIAIVVAFDARGPNFMFNVAGFRQAWTKCWTMLTVSIIIAVVFAWELIDRHHFFGHRVSDKRGLCPLFFVT